MKKRKRAPGGGRKPMGAFRGLTVSTSWRMPVDLYELLKCSREERSKEKGRKISLGQELLDRLRDSLSKDRDRLTRIINFRLRQRPDTKLRFYRLTADPKQNSIG
jgi:hypothetical protein